VGWVLKIVFLAISGFFFVATVLGALGVYLALTGEPKTCTDRNVSVSSAIAEQLDQRWAAFSSDITAEADSIDISEAEVTSRARQYAEDEDLPVRNLRVYFCDFGEGQVAGKVEAGGIDVDFVATGHLDLSGPRPVVQLDSIDVGNLPGFVSDAVLNALISEGTRTLELDENLVGSEIGDGLIIITGRP
jgi:hypothetical protein